MTLIYLEISLFTLQQFPWKEVMEREKTSDTKLE